MSSSSSAGPKTANTSQPRHRKPEAPNGPGSTAGADASSVGVGMMNGKAAGATYGPHGKLDPEGGEGKDYAQPEFGMKWYRDEDIECFANALAADPDNPNNPGARVEHISAITDFAPIQQRIKRSSKRNLDIVRAGWGYHVARWPLLAFIWGAIVFEFILYILVRQLVNVIEWSATWRGERGRLRQRLRKAKDYDAWKLAALELDDYLGFNRWKRHSAFAYYDSHLVKRVVHELHSLRESEDAEGVKAVLEVCLRNNFAGVESMRLYSESFLGTKELVERYVDEVERSIQFVRSTDLLSNEDKARFFRGVAKNFGTSALCLSGGAGFGYYHFGVIRALLDANLLPTIVTGTSAGALIAAITCCYTDAELDRLLVPSLSDMITACEEPFHVWILRWWKTGARFDTVDWARKAAFFTRGSTTFREAYERTGRVLNVSVIPYDQHSPTKLLNYLTAPNCVIFSAIIASAAVPGVLNPVVLLEKKKDGSLRPWEFQGRHKDGSLRVDIPLESLHLYFNAVYSVVSQVNPHVHLFFFQPRGAPGRPVAHRKGKGWRGGFFLSALEQFLKIELKKNFRVMRDLELMPQIAGQDFSSIFLQRYEGSITIWPRSRAWDWVRILSDPDRPELARMLDVGKRVTWPKIHMLDNRLRIERQIFQGRFEFTGLGIGAYTQRLDGTSVATSVRPKSTRGNSTSSDPFDHATFDESATMPPPHALDLVDETTEEETTDASEAGPSRGLMLSSTDAEAEPPKASRKKRKTKKRDIMLRLGLRGPMAVADPRGLMEKGRHIRASTEEPGHDDGPEPNLRERDLRRRYSLGALRLAEPLWDRTGENRSSPRVEDEAAGSSTDDADRSWEEQKKLVKPSADDDEEEESESDSDPGRPGQWIEEGRRR